MLQGKEPAQQSPGSGHRAFRGLRVNLQLGCVAASAGHMHTDTNSWAGAFSMPAYCNAHVGRAIADKIERLYIMQGTSGMVSELQCSSQVFDKPAGPFMHGRDVDNGKDTHDHDKLLAPNIDL